MLPTYIMLASGATAFDWDSMPLVNPGHLGSLDLSSNRGTKSGREKFQEDKISFFESLPDFYMVCRFTSENIRGEDEVIRSFRPYIKTKKIDIGLVFATQIWLDIRNVLRELCHQPFAQLKQTAHIVQVGLNANLKFHQQYALSCPNWPTSNDNVLRQILELTDDWVNNDPFFIMKHRHMSAMPGVSRLIHLCPLLSSLANVVVLGCEAPTRRQVRLLQKASAFLRFT